MISELFPRSIRNNNPFNIKVGTNNWLNALPLACNKDKGHVFEQFKEMKYGVRAGQKLLLNYIFLYGKKSIYDILCRFAPHSENYTDNYVDFVCRDYLGKKVYSPDTEIDSLDKFCHLCSRICKFESGINETALENLRLSPAWQKSIYSEFFSNVTQFNFDSK